MRHFVIMDKTWIYHSISPFNLSPMKRR